MTQHWYPFYWGDYSSKTLHLTQSQHGAYLLFLRYIYTTEKPIPHEQRYSIARAVLEQEQGDADLVLHSFFEQKGAFWHNERAELVITEANAKHEKRVNAGSKGGKCKSSNAKAKLKQYRNNAVATTTTFIDSGAKAPSSPPTPLPDWLPTEEWQAFKDMRRRMKSTLTPKAEQLAIGQLEKLQAEGEDPKAVIEQSILRGWKSFYKLKGTEDANTGRNTSSHHAAANRPGQSAIGESKWLTAAEQIIAEDAATGRWKNRI